MSSTKNSTKNRASAARPMRGEKAAKPPLDADALQHATLTWQNFYSSLDEVDKVVLNRAAAGHKLKVVCCEQNVSYDTLQKRFKRWQAQLGLPSLNTLLYVWRVVRADHAQTLHDEPSLMRHAPEVALETALRQQPGYKEVVLPEALRAGALSSKATRETPPSSSAKNAQTARKAAIADSGKLAIDGSGLPDLFELRAIETKERDRRLFAEKSERRDAEASATLADAMMSPSVWANVLDVGQGRGLAALDASDVVMGHRLFLALMEIAPIKARDSDAVSRSLAYLSNSDGALLPSTTGATSLSGGIELPLAISARRLGVLREVPESIAEADARQMSTHQVKRFWEQHTARLTHPAFSAHNDIAFWQRFCAFVKDEAKLRELVRTITLDLLLAPLTGMAVAALTLAPRYAAMHTDMSAIYQAFVLARRRHAQHLRVHPNRLLEYHAVQAAQIASQPSNVLMAANERLVLDSAAAVLPAHRGGYGRVRPVKGGFAGVTFLYDKATERERLLLEAVR
jgi:hypothetical protein